MNRKFTDIFFKYLFSVVALFSVLALGAILLFVFAQGIMPFFTSTSAGIRLVAQRIDEITVNGVTYIDHSTFIDIPKNTGLISIHFPSSDGEETLEIKVNETEKDPQKKLTFSYNGKVKITYPENYVYTVSWPAAFAALEKRIHVIIPEPPYSFGKFLAGLEWHPSRDKIFGIFPMMREPSSQVWERSF